MISTTGRKAVRDASPRIEPARFPKDTEAVRALFREYESAAGVPACFQGFEHELAELPGVYEPPAGALLVARDAGGALVGCVALKPAGDGTAEIKRLFIRAPARGQGLGRRLALSALEAARSARYRRVVLETHGSMQAAQALLRELGFKPHGAKKKGGDAAVIRMALNLADTKPEG
ncbi:MAG: GNAT family N-acetyltransferase [Alphaproteobacteria bacterium]